MHTTEDIVRGQIRNDQVYPAWLSAILGVVGILSLVFAGVCIWVGLKYPDPKAFVELKKILIAIWTVWPPTWIWIDYFFLYRRWGLHGSREAMKYGQEVVTKFWIGVGVVLSGLYYGHDVIKGLGQLGH